MNSCKKHEMLSGYISLLKNKKKKTKGKQSSSLIQYIRTSFTNHCTAVTQYMCRGMA
jgi:hypothetical protein